MNSSNFFLARYKDSEATKITDEDLKDSIKHLEALNARWSVVLDNGQSLSKFPDLGILVQETILTNTVLIDLAKQALRTGKKKGFIDSAAKVADLLAKVATFLEKMDGLL